MDWTGGSRFKQWTHNDKEDEPTLKTLLKHNSAWIRERKVRGKADKKKKKYTLVRCYKSEISFVSAYLLFILNYNLLIFNI